MPIPNPFSRDKDASYAEIIEFCKNPDLINYVVLSNRIGTLGWMTQVEFTWFKPDTDKNDEFFVSYMKWPEDFPIPFLIISIPKEYEAKASALLWQHGLRAVDPDFVQVVIDAEGAKRFPIEGDNVRTLENHSDGAAHVCYSNDPVKMDAAYKHETEFYERYHQEHLAWLNTPEGRKEARAYWTKHPGMGGTEPPYTGEPFE